MTVLSREKFNLFIVFWAIFGLKFSSILDTSALIFLPFIFYAKLNRELILFLILILLYTIQVLSLYVISGIFDSWHIFQPIKSLLVLFGLFGVLNYMKITNLKKYILKAVLIHSLIVIIFYFFPVLQNSLNELTGFVAKSPLRVNGLTHSYGTTSLMHIAALPLVFESSVNNKKLKIFIILLSSIFLARVGFYIGILYLIYKYISVFRIKRIFIVIGIFFISTYVLLWFVNTDPKSFTGSTQIYFLTFRWALETFIELYNNGVLTNKSSETLNFIFLNDDVITHLFGTGDFGRNTVHLKTDISYLLYYSYVGAIGCFLIFFIHSFLLFSKDKAMLFFSFIIFFTALKEPTFFTRGLWPIYVLYLYTLYESKNRITSS